MKGLRVCLQPGCPELVPSGRCPTHAKAVQQRYKRHVTSTPGVNYGRRWRKLREVVWAESPFCVDCGLLVPLSSAQLDHRTPHEGSPALFWSRANIQVMCGPCHSRKTAREVGIAPPPGPPAGHRGHNHA